MVQFEDHFRSGDPLRSGIICGAVQVATIEREFKFRKRMAFSALGSLRPIQLHSMLAVNNLGLKFVS